MIKDFSNFIMNEELDYSNVVNPDENYGFTSDDKTIVEQIEKVTNKKVTGIKGISGEIKMELYLTLDDNSKIVTSLDYEPYDSKLSVSYDNKSSNEYISKVMSYKELEEFGFKDNGIPGADIAFIISKILEEMEQLPSHFISFPKEVIEGKDYFHYDERDNAVHFANEEAAKKWISSLKIEKFED